MKEEKPFNLEQFADQVTLERRKRQQRVEESILAKKTEEERRIARITRINQMDLELLTTDPLRSVFIHNAETIDRIFPGTIVFCRDYFDQISVANRKYVVFRIPYIYGFDHETDESFIFGIKRSKSDEVEGLKAMVAPNNEYWLDIGKKSVIPIEEFTSDLGILLAAWIDPYKFQSLARHEAWRSPIIHQTPLNIQSAQEWRLKFRRFSPKDWNNRLYPN